MRIRLLGLSACLLLMAAGLARAAEDPPYYLALGDSLAIGFQPTVTGGHATNQGYVDDIYAVARLRVPGLQLKKLGCSGETSYTMIHGGSCRNYTTGNQLNDAIAFLQSHHVAFITLDV